MAKGKQDGPEIVMAGPMRLLGPAPHKCQTCAVEHPPDDPHDAQSLYYQMAFYQKNGRWPTWKDALAHCSPEMRAAWREGLIDAGVSADEID